jgi:hypothetical protein
VEILILRSNNILKKNKERVLSASDWELDISNDDSGALLAAKIKSYLLYPGADKAKEREQVVLSLYLDALLRRQGVDDTIKEFFTPRKLFVLNSSPAIEQIHEVFEKRVKHEFFTVGILVRLLASGARHHPNKVSVTVAEKIFAGSYLRRSAEGKNEKSRPMLKSSAHNHWLALEGAQHLCAAWKLYQSLVRKEELNGPLRDHMCMVLAFANKYAAIISKGNNSWRENLLSKSDQIWNVPKTFVLPKVSRKQLKLFSKKKMDLFAERYVTQAP